MKVKLRKPTKYSKDVVDPSAIAQTERDVKDAVLTVSVFANLFALCLWVALQTTSDYDTALINFFLAR